MRGSVTSGKDTGAVPEEVPPGLRQDVLAVEGAHDAAQLLGVALQQAPDLPPLLQPGQVPPAAGAGLPRPMRRHLHSMATLSRPHSGLSCTEVPTALLDCSLQDR